MTEPQLPGAKNAECTDRLVEREPNRLLGDLAFFLFFGALAGVGFTMILLPVLMAKFVASSMFGPEAAEQTEHYMALFVMPISGWYAVRVMLPGYFGFAPLLGFNRRPYLRPADALGVVRKGLGNLMSDNRYVRSWFHARP